MIKYTKQEKIDHIENMIHTKNERFSASSIQNELKGSPWSFRRQEIQKIVKAETVTKPIETIQKDNNMFPSTKANLISIVLKNARTGNNVKTLDMIRTIYNPAIVDQRYQTFFR